jgi:hypothetical protein
MNNEKYQDLDQEIIDFFKETESEFNMPVVVRYVFQAVTKQNELIKISKVPEQFINIVKADLLVQINPLYYDSFDEQTNKILFEEKIDYITYNMNTGAIKLSKPKIQIGTGLANKHGFDNVVSAKESEKALKAQLDEKAKEGKK